MKKFLFLLIIPALIYGLTLIQNTYASGDKVRGDGVEGDANQVQAVECQAWDEWCIDP